MEKLLEILSDIRPDIDFANEEGLIDNGLLGSLDIMSIVAELTDEFDIVISPADIIPSNFNSAKALWAMVERLK
ncbi:MAG: acyl carrier protein [Clostridiales bacterium]|nr:acyl carrier protein [Clostridiales bacterium]